MGRGPPTSAFPCDNLCTLMDFVSNNLLSPSAAGLEGRRFFIRWVSWWLHLTYLPSNNITARNVTFVFPPGDLFQCSALFWAQTITPPLPSPQFKKFSPDVCMECLLGSQISLLGQTGSISCNRTSKVGHPDPTPLYFLRPHPTS